MTMGAGAAPSHRREAIIERIEPRTARVYCVFLCANVGAHDAGQHVDVHLTAGDGYQAQRSYCIASPPGATRIELAIDALEDGEVSAYFHDVARAGDTVEICGPIGGHFVWRVGDGGPLLLVAAGFAIVPLMAIARHRARNSRGTTALLVCSARTRDDLVFRDERLRMEDDDANFAIVATTTRGARHHPQDYHRRLDRSLLRDLLHRWGHTARQVYACGSNVFGEAVTGSLVLEAVPAERIRTERFGGKP